jgi:hypothetical protein
MYQNVPQACIIPYTIRYASNICHYHKYVPLTMNHNNHIQCTKDMSQACINDTKTWTSTICNHIPKGPPRHASSMCHTIHDTSLNQTYKRHTFTHEEDLVHTVSYQQTNLVHVIFNKQEIPSSSNPFP